MSSSIITWLFVSTVLGFSGTAMQISHERHNNELEERNMQNLPDPAQGLAMTLPGNIFTIADNFNRYIRCEMPHGTGLSQESCNNALGYMPKSARMETWGYPEYLPPGTAIDEALPNSFWSDDGLCTISTSVIENRDIIGKASQLNVSATARDIIERCVIKQYGVGGSARVIGGNHELLVEVKKFHPAVTCQGTLWPDKESCGRIVDNMPKNWQLKRFGLPGDTTAPNKLPISLRGREGKCELFINTWGPSVTTNWYAIWQASAATLAMCLRRRLTGRSNVAVGDQVLPGLYVEFRFILPGQAASFAQNTSNTTTMLPVDSSAVGAFGDAILETS